jgi:rhodanese-related sulfurtransferase
VSVPTHIDRHEVQRLLASGAQLVDVLPAKEYAESRLPRAINIPLPKLDRKTTARLSHDQPVVVYCNDLQ